MSYTFEMLMIFRYMICKSFSLYWLNLLSCWLFCFTKLFVSFCICLLSFQCHNHKVIPQINVQDIALWFHLLSLNLYCILNYLYMDEESNFIHLYISVHLALNYLLNKQYLAHSISPATHIND